MQATLIRHDNASRCCAAGPESWLQLAYPCQKELLQLVELWLEDIIVKVYVGKDHPCSKHWSYNLLIQFLQHF